MARISIEDLTVDSFVTGSEPQLWDGGIGAEAIALTYNRGCICTADIRKRDGAAARRTLPASSALVVPLNWLWLNSRVTPHTSRRCAICWPLVIDSGMPLPCMAASLGLGSNVSRWEGPPAW